MFQQALREHWQETKAKLDKTVARKNILEADVSLIFSFLKLTILACILSVLESMVKHFAWHRKIYTSEFGPLMLETKSTAQVLKELVEVYQQHRKIIWGIWSCVYAMGNFDY